MKIITHPGSAHFDDVCAVALLKATIAENAEVERREPTKAEIEDEFTFCVDIGGEHNEERNNFDHHQYQGGLSAFRLVAQFLGIDALACKIFAWWETASKLDTLGPFNMAREMGTSGENIFKLYNPITKYWIERFEKNPGSYWVEEFGKYLINEIQEIDARLQLLRKESYIEEINGLKILFSRIEEKPHLAIPIYTKEVGANITITPAEREPWGWVCYRVDDHPRVDFTRVHTFQDQLGVVAGDVRIGFIHQNGFMCVTTDKSVDWREVVKEAIV
jgi:hypothetical protein